MKTCFSNKIIEHLAAIYYDGFHGYCLINVIFLAILTVESDISLFKIYYTKEERAELLGIYLKNNKNNRAALPYYSNIHPERLPPSKNVFKRIYTKFLTSYSLENKKRTLTRNEDEELEILLYFQENPGKSIRDACI